jgi:peptide/nickel transport system ATP-binding protein
MSQELLRVEHLKKYFKTPGGSLHAVDDVSFTLGKGETLGVVGESGCGKSTLGRAILGLNEATDGKVIFDGEDITHVSSRKRRQLCQDLQIIFQDPFSSLDPRKSVWDLIADPLIINHACKSKDELKKRVSQLMDTVGLARRLTYSYPHELDGGRRQRIGIARALALNPRFVVCDEPVSALDVSIQAQILNLLQDLQEEHDLTYLFITHDLSVVKHISNDIMVMYVGSMVEKSPSRDLFANPLHPYTKGLLSAIPVPVVNRNKKRVIMKGEISSPINPKPGCRFATRCPYATEECHCTQPVLEEIRPNHFVACHHVREINQLN